MNAFNLLLLGAEGVGKQTWLDAVGASSSDGGVWTTELAVAEEEGGAVAVRGLAVVAMCDAEAVARLPTGCADAAIIVYDVTDAASYESVAALYSAAVLVIGRAPRACIAVVGNKLDARAPRITGTYFAQRKRVCEWKASFEGGYNTLSAVRYLLRKAGDNPGLWLERVGALAFADHKTSRAVETIPSAQLTHNEDAEDTVHGRQQAELAASAGVAAQADPSDDDVVRADPGACACDLAPMLRRCVKRNQSHPHHGRPYWACANDWYRSCGFFCWADLTEDEAAAQAPVRELETAVVCHVHGLPTVRRMTTRLGVNFARAYLVCSNAQRCAFFQWADRPVFKFERWSRARDRERRDATPAESLAATTTPPTAPLARHDALDQLLEDNIVKAYVGGHIPRETAHKLVAALDREQEDQTSTAQLEGLVDATRMFLEHEDMDVYAQALLALE